MINAFKQIRLTNYGVSGANGRLNVNASGLAYYSELTGASGVLQTNIASTGSTLQGQINSLSGTLTGGYATIPFVTGASGTLSDRLTQTGSNLDGKITSLSGTLTGNYATTNYVTGVSGALSSRLVQTGSDLNTRINSLSGTLTGEYATRAYVTGASGSLQTQIDGLNTSLSGSYVTLGTTQTITGNKTFNSTVYIKDLYVTGTQTIVNTQVTNVGSNYLTLNATGGARDGGLFINLNSGGVNTSGAYIGFDVPSNTFRIGTGVSGLADLSVLDTIATQAYVSNFVGTNLVYTTGAQTISGAKTFDSAVSLNTQATTTSHAVRADRNINGGSGLSNGGNLTSDVTLNVGQGYGISVSADAVAVNTSEVVVTTGTQTIAGSKTFSSSVTIPQATTTGHAVAAARIISGGSGLAGGANLTSDVTLNIGQGYGITVNADDIAVNTSQVVVTTGSQTIVGEKSFNVINVNQIYGGDGSVVFTMDGTSITIADSGVSKGISFVPDGTFNIYGGNGAEINFTSKYITGFTNISGTNIYQGTNRVVDSSQTGNFITSSQTGAFASTGNLNQTGSNLQTQISSLSGTLTGNYVTTQFANATYATLVALNQKINWISGQSQAFTNSVTTGVDTQFITFPAAFTGGVVPTVQVTLDIPSNSDYMYNVAVRGVTTSGFTALYSDVVLETGVVLNVWASKLYGSI